MKLIFHTKVKKRNKTLKKSLLDTFKKRDVAFSNIPFEDF